MKKTKQVLGLPVIEISSGEQLGLVSGIVVSPEKGKVESLLLDREKWYGEMRSLPFASLLGIGEFAVTITKAGDVFPVSSRDGLGLMLEKNVQVVKAGVMTRSGTYIGTVSEFILDDKTGEIMGCEVLADDGGNFTVPGDKVVTYGAKFLVIEDGHEEYKVSDLPEVKPAAVKGGTVPPAQPAKGKTNVPADPVEVFESRQRQYLAGKKATKKITGPGGQLIVDAGDVITEEIIEKALSMDKYIELTMNVAD